MGQMPGGGAVETMRFGDGRSGGRIRPEGTRASANTSGPDFVPGASPVKLRIVKDTRTERRKLVSSAGPS